MKLTASLMTVRHDILLHVLQYSSTNDIIT